MRGRRLSEILLTLLILLVGSLASGQERTYEPGRANLTFPPEFWKQVRAEVGFEGRPIGYNAEQMNLFPPARYTLRLVKNSFRDVEDITRFSGALTDVVLAKRDTIDDILASAFRILDVRVAREFTAPPDTGWHSSWISDSLDEAEVFEAILDSTRRAGIRNPISRQARQEWDKLPVGTRRLVLRTILAGAEARPLLEQAWNERFLADALGVNDISEVSREELYEFAMEPFKGRAGVLRSSTVDAIGEINYDWLGFGSIVFVRGVRRAVNWWQAEPDSLKYCPDGFAGCSFQTFLGEVKITGCGPDTIDGGGRFFTLGLGGDNVYTGLIAGTGSPREPLSVVIDLEGDDTYDSGDINGGLACGLFGVGLLIDLDGNDIYRCKESGIGRGLHGVGILLDYAGDDHYDLKTAWGQGAAHAGLGLLIDIAGDDEYVCGHQAQGFGGTMGVGMLVDGSGNDRYRARDDANVSEPFWSYSVSFVQGTAFGRRADFADGHSLAGGVGVFTDGEGDDELSGQVYCQGAGYWWGMGICEMKGGNNKYTAHWYSLGAAPHFAIGVFVDLEGDDEYNVGNDSLVNQVMGVGRDGSIGVFMDGGGNDKFRVHQACAGSGDLVSIGLFWSRAGDDEFEFVRQKSLPEIAFGQARKYPPFRNFFDDLPTVGIFLNTQGKDRYTEKTMPDVEEELDPVKFGDNKRWHHDAGPKDWGFGWDIDWFGSAEPVEKKD